MQKQDKDSVQFLLLQSKEKAPVGNTDIIYNTVYCNCGLPGVKIS